MTSIKKIISKGKPSGFADHTTIALDESLIDIKGELKNMEEDIERRISTGSLTKIEVRILRNRLSAARSRHRKRAVLGTLETQIKTLESERKQLNSELSAQAEATDKAAADAARLRGVLESLMPMPNNNNNTNTNTNINITTPEPVPSSSSSSSSLSSSLSSSPVPVPCIEPATLILPTPQPLSLNNKYMADVVDYGHMCSQWSDAIVVKEEQTLGSPIDSASSWCSAEDDEDVSAWLNAYLAPSTITQ